MTTDLISSYLKALQDKQLQGNQNTVLGKSSATQSISLGGQAQPGVSSPEATQAVYDPKQTNIPNNKAFGESQAINSAQTEPTAQVGTAAAQETQTDTPQYGVTQDWSASNSETVQDLNLGKSVLNLASAADKTILGGTDAGGYAGAGATAIGTGLNAYMALEGNADEKKQAYLGLGEQAAVTGVKTYAPEIVATVGDVAGESAAGAVSGIASGVSTAMPYYALAKAGGTAVHMITDNNPQYRDTPFGRLQSVEEPLAVEQWWGKEAADHGVGNAEQNEAFVTANPLEVGGWINDTTDKVKDVVSGGVSGMRDFYQASSDDVKNVADVLSGGFTAIFGTVVCTQLYKQDKITKEIYKADGKFGKQMDKKEYQWYLSWGIPLAHKMSGSKFLSSIVAFFMVPVSEYMAGEMGVGKGNFFGKVCFKVLQMICKVVGG